MEARANILAKRIEPDIDAKVRTSIRFLNETIQYNANEPSSAFYRIQVNKKYQKEKFVV